MTLFEEKGERLAKRMARAGLCSRRDAERWIAQGRVMVDGQPVTTPATLVTDRTTIIVDGKLVKQAPSPRLWIYYKPAGLLTTHYDPQGRPTIFECLPDPLRQEGSRVISVGRLDLNSEGLILLTNDGALARYAELPSTGWARSYRVRVYGTINVRDLTQLSKGITIDGITYAPIEAEIVRNSFSTGGSNSWVAMTLYEGKNREIRKVMEYLGLRVNRLVRIAYGPFLLEDMEVGQVREVSDKKVREAFAGLKNG